MTAIQEGEGDPPSVPAPVPPDDPGAWYAPAVCAQYEVHPGVVATVSEREGEGFHYSVREPPLSPAERESVDRIREHFAAARPDRPLTREGTRERMAAGFDPKYRMAIDRLAPARPAARRRIDYHALRDLKCLGALTPLALDDRIESADAAALDGRRGDAPPWREGEGEGDPPPRRDGREGEGDGSPPPRRGDPGETDGADPPATDRLVVHTEDFAPAVTDLPADPDHIERFAAERTRAFLSRQLAAQLLPVKNADRMTERSKIFQSKPLITKLH